MIFPSYYAKHNRGNTLDLARSNIQGAQCTIVEHLYTSSDHETLVSIIPLRRCSKRLPRTRYIESPDALQNFASGVEEIMPPSYLLPRDFDDLAYKKIECIQCNMQQFLSRRKFLGSGTRWWNDDCIKLAADFRRVRRLRDATFEKKKFRKTTRVAKNYSSKPSYNTSCSKDIF